MVGNNNDVGIAAPDMNEAFSKPVEASLSTHKRIVLEWNQITYTVPLKDEVTKETKEKVILHSMSGKALPGELLGIMGTSGAGKSTLLDVLGCRLDTPTVHGTIYTNGSAVDKKKFRKEIGYVMQSDALFPLLTVRETIQYAAYLRIAGNFIN